MGVLEKNISKNWQAAPECGRRAATGKRELTASECNGRAASWRMGQAASEYITIIGGAMLVVLLAAAIIVSLTGETPDARIGLSHAYWRSASPVMVAEWNAFSAQPDAGGSASAQVALLVQNAGANQLVLKKISLAGYNFSKAYAYGSRFAGAPDNLSIRLSPSEQMMIVLVQESGPAIKGIYQMDLSFDFTVGGDTRAQVGLEPLRGKLDSAPLPIGNACDIGQNPCNQTGTAFCCQSSQICSAGIMCCENTQVACGGACCDGICIAGVCRTGCLAFGNCPAPDYAVQPFVADQAALTIGQTAQINATTKNVGSANATALSYTKLYRTFSGVKTAHSNFAIAPLDAGAPMKNTTTFTCDAASVGTNVFEADADNTSQIAESNENNNAATLTITCTNSNLKPDYLVSVAANAAVLSIGQAATIFANTSNIGTAAAASNSITRLATNGSGNPIAPIQFTISPLAAGGKSQNSATFSCGMGSRGMHMITATADNGSQIAELDETNNANSSLSIFCGGPDLAANISVNGTSPKNAALLWGQAANISVTTSNIGSTDAGISTTQIIASGPGSPVSPASLDIGLLTPGLWQAKYATFTCDASTDGKYYINASADFNSQVVELNESNNMNGTLNISCAMPVPDMAVANMTAPSYNLSVGQGVNITVVTKNIGTNISLASETRVNRAGALILLGVGQLAPNATDSQNVTFNCTTSTLGQKNISAMADWQWASGETNRTNNNRSMIINCSDRRPDLVIAAIYYNNTAPWKGESVKISAVTKNIIYNPLGVANVSVTKIYDNNTLLLNASVGPLNPQQNQTINATFACTESARGCHSMIMGVADENDGILETIETNNVLQGGTLICRNSTRCAYFSGTPISVPFVGLAPGAADHLGGGKVNITTGDNNSGQVMAGAFIEYQPNPVFTDRTVYDCLAQMTVEGDVYIERGFYDPALPDEGPDGMAGILMMTPTNGNYPTGDQTGYVVFLNRFNKTDAGTSYPYSQYLCIGELNNYDPGHAYSYRQWSPWGQKLRFNPNSGASMQPVAPYQKCALLSSPVQLGTTYHLKLEIYANGTVTGRASGNGISNASVTNNMPHNYNYAADRVLVGGMVAEGQGRFANVCYYSGFGSGCSCGQSLP